MIEPTSRALEGAYRGRRVLVTGHTGFKGGWLVAWLSALEAQVWGFALPAPTSPSFFVDADVAGACRHHVGDVRDLEAVRRVVRESRPEVVFHLAAQSLVRASYEAPVETLATNVMGTAHVLEALRLEGQRSAVVVVTSDKCYENREWTHGYRESDALGGHDVYSSSKAGAELVAQSWRRSFFPASRHPEHGVAIATARAGNVIGGGDWAPDRIVPDAIRALEAGRPVPMRNPGAVRPWQHVVEPLGGYLLLGARLLGPHATHCTKAWNFGPAPQAAVPVSALVAEVVRAWGSGCAELAQQPQAPHEAGLLRLSIDQAVAELSWAPRWSLPEAVGHAVAWYRARHAGLRGAALRHVALDQCRAWLQVTGQGA